MFNVPPSAFGAPLLIFLACAAGLDLVKQCSAAEPGALPPTAERTASWYEANPGFMRRMLAACRNDPGHGWNHPDCINARAGEVLEAEKSARRAAGMSGDLTPPSSPRYWIIHPNELPGQLQRCSKLSPEAQRAYFCDAARAASGRVVAR